MVIPQGDMARKLMVTVLIPPGRMEPMLFQLILPEVRLFCTGLAETNCKHTELYSSARGTVVSVEVPVFCTVIRKLTTSSTTAVVVLGVIRSLVTVRPRRTMFTEEIQKSSLMGVPNSVSAPRMKTVSLVAPQSAAARKVTSTVSEFPTPRGPRLFHEIIPDETLFAAGLAERKVKQAGS